MSCNQMKTCIILAKFEVHFHPLKLITFKSYLKMIDLFRKW